MPNKVIKIDGAFPEFRGNELLECLENGWRIVEKVYSGNRYTTYLLHKDDNYGTPASAS